MVLAKMLKAVSSSMAYLVGHHCGVDDLSFIIIRNRKHKAARSKPPSTGMNCSPGINARNL
jgi:hypothetical protein